MTAEEDAQPHRPKLTRDLPCPGCRYNLRGLPGRVVTCPECGRELDRASLVHRRWTRPWHQAPGLGTLQWPAATLLLMAVISGVMMVVLDRPTALIATESSLALTTLLLWSYLMRRAHRALGGMEGVLLALLIHGLIGGYLLVLAGAAFAVTWMVQHLFTGRFDQAAISAIVGLAMLLLGAGLRRVERFIADRCIRRHLLRQAGLANG